MAAFSPESLTRHLAPACVLACLLAAASSVPANGQEQPPIVLDAASSDFDRRNERLLFREVRIRQGEISIAADQAESRDLDFSSGSWSFTGNVRISGPMGDIQSDRATVSFVSHRLVRATADGAPARFSRTMEEDDRRVVNGTANRITYDLGRGELELAGQAALRDGLREVAGGRLLYRIAEDRLIASSDDEQAERVRIIITPPGTEQDGPDQDRRP